MLVYNVTIKADHHIHTAWLQWLKEEHIPDMIGTKCFSHAMIYHLPDADDEEGITYAVQYHAASREAYEQYIADFASVMRQKSFDKWGDKVIAFRTVMEAVN